MRKIFVMMLCMELLFSALNSLSAQQQPVHKPPADTTGIKIDAPLKLFRKDKEQIKKKENKELPLREAQKWNDDRPLLMKEKDSVQTKTK